MIEVNAPPTTLKPDYSKKPMMEAHDIRKMTKGKKKMGKVAMMRAFTKHKKTEGE